MSVQMTKGFSVRLILYGLLNT